MDKTQKENVKEYSSKEGIKVLFRYVSTQKIFFYSTIVSILFVSIIASVVPYLVGQFLDELTLIGTAQEISEKAWLLIILITMTFLLTLLGRWVTGYVSTRLSVNLISEYRVKAINTLLNYPISFFKKRKTGEIHEIITRTEDSLSDFIGYQAPSVLADFSKLILSMGFVFYISFQLGSILFFGLFIFAVLVFSVTPKIKKATKDLNDALNDIKNDFFESITNIFEIKRNSNEQKEITKIQNAYRGPFLEKAYREDDIWNNTNVLRRIILYATQISLYVMAMFLIINNEITVGEVVAIFLYVNQVFGPIGQISNVWLFLQRALVKLKEGEELLDYPTEDSGSFEGEVEKGEIEFKSVNFGYEDNEIALKNISFTVPAGSTIALVGESGAGKTTTIDLLGGYYMPDDGEILIDGESTNRYTKETLRSALGYVSQEVTLFNDTIRNNIAYGAVRDVSQGDIEKAAKQAGAHTFISKLTDGYDQSVGERGLVLSVGQKQRIAIARAFLRDPKILVLDEPTSALDAKTERHITDSLNTLMKDRTTVIIAHRLSTTRTADQILVFKDGEIIERGSHKELIDMNGEYTMMYNEHVGLS